MSDIINIWTDVEDAKLIELVNAGELSAQQIAANVGRSKSACAKRANTLRKKGEELWNPQLVRTGERGSPRRKVPKYPLSTRLAADVRAAFLELGQEFGDRPGVLLEYAIERMLHEGEKATRASCARTVDGGTPRVPVCWSIPMQLAKDAAAHTEATRLVAAERAVLALLREYGFKIKDKT